MPVLRSLSLLLASLLAFTTCLASGQTEQFTLNNGLKLITHVDDRSPVVICQVWYRVGAMDEPAGKTGLSHVLEHMMFKGTHQHPENGYTTILNHHGGNPNAYTSEDFTMYFVEVEKHRLPLVLSLEADRMVHLHFDTQAFSNEHQVVMEERRMRVEDRPEGLAHELFRALAYTTSPYQNPTIGWQQDLLAMTQDDVMAWYQQWYAPNHATLVIVGDVEPQEVYRHVNLLFGDIPPSTQPHQNIIREIPHRGKREGELLANVRVPYLLMGYSSTPLSLATEPWEPYALTLLSAVLSHGDASRFSERLIRGQRVAASASTHYNPFDRADNQWMVSAYPNQRVSINHLEEAILTEIEELKTTKISPEELQRVVRLLITEHAFEQDNMFNQAMLLGKLDNANLDLDLAERFYEQLQHITPDQLQQAAQKYLISDNLTIMRTQPGPHPPTRPGAKHA